jgi:hypothetical protein
LSNGFREKQQRNGYELDVYRHSALCLPQSAISPCYALLCSFSHTWRDWRQWLFVLHAISQLVQYHHPQHGMAYVHHSTEAW